MGNTEKLLHFSFALYVLNIEPGTYIAPLNAAIGVFSKALTFYNVLILVDLIITAVSFDRLDNVLASIVIGEVLIKSTVFISLELMKALL